MFINFRQALLAGAVLFSAGWSFPARAETAVPLTPAAAAKAPEPVKRGIRFVDVGFEKALEMAKAASKPLLVDIYATWCSPCKELEEKIFTRPDVGIAASEYVAVRIDGEKGEGPAVHKRYHVTGYPTVLFLTPSGDEIDRVFGLPVADELMKSLVEFRLNKGTLADLSDKLATAGAKADISLVYEVGYRHALRGDSPIAEKLLSRVGKMDPDNASGWGAKSLYALGAWLYNPTEDWGRASKAFARLLARYPESAEAKDALKPLAKAYFKLGKPKEVRATLDRIIAGETIKAKPYNVYAWFCFQNKFDMARGVEVAKKGLEIEPKNAGLWDTLAELHFAMGRPADAVAAIKAAMEIEPGDAYFKTQLERFSAKPGK